MSKSQDTVAAKNDTGFLREHGLGLAIALDRTYLTLNLAVIAGSTSLLIADRVNRISGGFFILGILVCALSVLATILHMQFLSKRLLATAEWLDGAIEIPDDSGKMTATEDLVQKFQAQEAFAYTKQTSLLFFGVLFCAFGLMVFCWDSFVGLGLLWLGILALSVATVLGFCFGLKIALWKSEK